MNEQTKDQRCHRSNVCLCLIPMEHGTFFFFNSIKIKTLNYIIKIKFFENYLLT